MILIIFAMTLCFVLPTLAADSVTSTTAEPGDTVTFSMQISQETKAQAGGIAISYDSERLELVSGEWHLTGTIMAPFFSDTALGAFAFATEKAVSGEIFTVSFRVRDNAPAGAAVVALVLELRDKTNTGIANLNNGGVINIVTPSQSTTPVETTAPIVTTAPVVTTAR